MPRMILTFNLVAMLMSCTLIMAVLWECDGDAGVKPAVAVLFSSFL